MPEAATEAQGSARRLGPGCIALVVGPSGVGKDTLIAFARERLAGEPRIVFPRRVVTREPDPALEDHGTLSPEDFERSVAGGRFALHWRAHGCSYGVPAEIDQTIEAGGLIVVNVSRSVVAIARARYADVLPIVVTAPPAILAERLRVRGRETGSDIVSRLSRNATTEVLPDAVRIANDGPIEQAGRALIALLLDRLASGRCSGPAPFPSAGR